ncbi:hypothetical protein QJS66_00920 [Kocuria rhizophila]|nr:hypothetical protein QJS66_00920 [Kocuria rhizophila]
MERVGGPVRPPGACQPGPRCRDNRRHVHRQRLRGRRSRRCGASTTCTAGPWYHRRRAAPRRRADGPDVPGHRLCPRPRWVRARRRAPRAGRVVGVWPRLPGQLYAQATSRPWQTLAGRLFHAHWLRPGRRESCWTGLRREPERALPGRRLLQDHPRAAARRRGRTWSAWRTSRAGGAPAPRAPGGLAANSDLLHGPASVRWLE